MTPSNDSRSRHFTVGDLNLNVPFLEQGDGGHKLDSVSHHVFVTGVNCATEGDDTVFFVEHVLNSVLQSLFNA